MNAVEEIQAAIDKLTALKAESTGGPWVIGDRPTEVRGEWAPGSSSIQTPWVADVQLGDRDAELIVTLHRTIDAQLAILNDFIERYGMRRADDWEPIAPAARNALTLARAINGGTN